MAVPGFRRFSLINEEHSQHRIVPDNRKLPTTVATTTSNAGGRFSSDVTADNLHKSSSGSRKPPSPQRSINSEGGGYEIDITRPHMLSGVYMDPKMVRKAVADIVQTSKNPDADFEKTVAEFLTNMGYAIFQQGPLGRQTASSSIRSADDFAPPISTPSSRCKRKTPLNLVKTVHHQNPSQKRLPRMRTVPSHIVSQHSLPEHYTKRYAVDSSKAARTRQQIQKEEFVRRFKNLLQREILEKQLLQAETRQSKSRWQQIEHRLLYEALPHVIQRKLIESGETRARTEVLVVGAGLAGLSAARKLMCSGFQKVTVLEAQNKVGGRILGIGLDENDPCNILDMGVTGIDYPGHDNSLWVLAECAGLAKECVEGTKPENNSHLKYKDGMEYITDVTGLPLMTNIRKDADAVFREVCQGSPSSKGICLSGLDYTREKHRRFQTTLASMNIVKDHETTVELQETTNKFLTESEFLMEDDKGDLGVHELGRHKHMTGDDVTVHPRGGMVSLINFIIDKQLRKAIKYNAEVEFIDWSDFNVKNARSRQDSKVKVICKDGREFEAKHVIVTVPLGYLKAHADHMFKPSLSEEKLRAIRDLGWANSSKAYLVYDSPICSKPINIISRCLLSGSNSCKLSSNTVVGLKSHPIHKHILELQSTGAIIESTSDADIIQVVTEIVKTNLQRNLPSPIKVHKSKWGQKSTFKGTHPYLSAKCTGDEITILSEPLRFRNVPVILFAGDATFQQYRCLAHAARASGLREANRLCNIYNDIIQYANTMK